jgi:hypothetical protein
VGLRPHDGYFDFYFFSDILDRMDIGHMDTNFLIQITNNLYRLTLFFPEKDPLRYKMREKANNILINSNNGNKYAVMNLLLEDLEVLDLFFEVAKEQDWVNVSDILVVQTGYLRLKRDLKEWRKLNGVHNVERGQFSPSEISERQKKILNFIKEQNGNNVQVHQVQQLFPQLSKRTLRRDFEQMLNKGLIKRVGEKNGISYQIISNS